MVVKARLGAALFQPASGWEAPTILWLVGRLVGWAPTASKGPTIIRAGFPGGPYYL